MPAPLSGDLSERIVAAIRDGSSMRGAAARFSVSPSSAIKLMARFRATGSVAPARYGGHRRPVLLPHEELLRALVTERADICPPLQKGGISIWGAGSSGVRNIVRRRES